MSYFASPAMPLVNVDGFGLQQTLPVSQMRTETVYARPKAVTTASATTRPEPATSKQSEPGAWPQSLRRYVERAFAAALEGDAEQRQRLQHSLKEVISEAQRRGEIWTRDWNSLPLPEVSVSHPVAQPTYAHRVAQFRRRADDTDSSDSEGQPRRLHKRGRSPDLPRAKAAKKKVGKRAKGATLPVGLDGPPVQDYGREQARARRFGSGAAQGAVPLGSQSKGRRWDWAGGSVENESSQDQIVKGTCQVLEKSYFRLTSKPEPSTVRPEPVLRAALDRLVGLLWENRVSYFYAADQFKGLRQDCTVQHIRSELSASIYEAAARCALEHGDMGEYNQCQGQLLQHYSAGIRGSREEFLAYRILYQAGARVDAGPGNRAALMTCLQDLTSEDSKLPAVRHALQARKALAGGNYLSIPVLYMSAPNMGRTLLDLILAKIRFSALKTLTKVYLPTLPLASVARWLGFLAPPTNPAEHPSGWHSPLPGSTQTGRTGSHLPTGDLVAALQDCEIWLRSTGAVLIRAADGQALDCKASHKQLHPPEATVAGSQGPELAIDDFLSRAAEF